MHKLYVSTINDSNFRPTLEKGNIIICGLTSEYKGAGLYLMNLSKDEEPILVRVGQKLKGGFSLTQDAIKPFNEAMTASDFKRKCFAKVLWVAKSVDLSMPEMEDHILDHLYGIGGFTESLQAVA